MKTITRFLAGAGAMAVALFVLLALAGCDKSEVPKNNTAEVLGKMKHSNMAGAKALFRTGGSMTRGGDGEEPRLWQIGIDEQTKSVIFTDQDGNSVPAIVDKVMNISSKYLVLRIVETEADMGTTNKEAYHFVVRKSDGELCGDYAWEDDTLGYWGILGNLFGWQNWQTFKTDAQGNFYIGTDRGIYKVYESGGRTTISKVTDNTYAYWNLNGAGDIFSYPKYYKADGTMINTELLGDGMSYIVSIAGVPDSFFRYEDIVEEYVYKRTVLAKYTATQSTIEREEAYVFPDRLVVGNLPVEVAGTVVFNARERSDPEVCYACVFSGSEPSVNYYPLEPGGCLADGNSVPAVTKTHMYAYCVNDLLPYYGRISRFNPATGEAVENYFTLPSQYELRDIFPYDSGMITILAKRAGGAVDDLVYLELDAAGQLTERGTYNSLPITLFERLN